jgi:hypothetical protein
MIMVRCQIQCISQWAVTGSADYKMDRKKCWLKKAFRKKIIVIFSDGSKHECNYGALNIDKVVQAIRQNG